MNISPLVMNKCEKNSNPTFGYWHRAVYRKSAKSSAKELMHYNDTSFVRHLSNKKKKCSNAQSWLNLIDFLIEKYKNVSKVNVYNYACSDCSEGYTFLMALISRAGEDIQAKFPKIYAIDYDKDAIDKAKQAKYVLNQWEYDSIQELTNNNIERFLNIEQDEQAGGYLATPKEILTSKIKLVHADVLKDYKRIKKENSIVFARNFWPYLDRKMASLLEKFDERIKKNSVLVIGGFDLNACPFFGFDIFMEIIKKGFKKSKVDCTFEK